MAAMGYGKELEAIDAGRCPICDKMVGSFRNANSIKEFKISGMCQACQDDFFEKD